MKVMLTTYIVTPELTTSKFTKLLRFFRLKKKREEFKVTFSYSGYKPKDVLYNDGNGCFMDSCGHDCGCYIRRPKLDQNGCLILKRSV